LDIPARDRVNVHGSSQMARPARQLGWVLASVGGGHEQ
jgi:hypothetical protein